MLEQLFLQTILKYSSNQSYNDQCWREIEKQYSSKSRHYHNLIHLEKMFEELEEVKAKIKNLDSLIFAIFYHDIIYKARKSDNEYQSAILFEKRISKTSFEFIQDCKRKIELTKEHLNSDDQEVNYLMDLDLSILGKSPDEYLIYSKNIRQEYIIYPDFLYYKGRRKALESLLNLESLFKTDYFKLKYEEQAQMNLKNELLSL